MYSKAITATKQTNLVPVNIAPPQPNGMNSCEILNLVDRFRSLLRMVRLLLFFTRQTWAAERLLPTDTCMKSQIFLACSVRTIHTKENFFSPRYNKYFTLQQKAWNNTVLCNSVPLNSHFFWNWTCRNAPSFGILKRFFALSVPNQSEIINVKIKGILLLRRRTSDEAQRIRRSNHIWRRYKHAASRTRNGSIQKHFLPVDGLSNNSKRNSQLTCTAKRTMVVLRNITADNYTIDALQELSTSGDTVVFLTTQSGDTVEQNRIYDSTTVRNLYVAIGCLAFVSVILLALDWLLRGEKKLLKLRNRMWHFTHSRQTAPIPYRQPADGQNRFTGLFVFKVAGNNWTSKQAPHICCGFRSAMGVCPLLLEVRRVVGVPKSGSSMLHKKFLIEFMVPFVDNLLVIFKDSTGEQTRFQMWNWQRRVKPNTLQWEFGAVILLLKIDPTCIVVRIVLTDRNTSRNSDWLQGSWLFTWMRGVCFGFHAGCPTTWQVRTWGLNKCISMHPVLSWPSSHCWNHAASTR